MTFTKKSFEGLNAEQIYSIFGGKDKRGVTNAAIRSLLTVGYNRSQVSKMLDIRYQHVRNVELQELKRGPAVKVEEIIDEGIQLSLDL
jgi:hypothetical protein